MAPAQPVVQALPPEPEPEAAPVSASQKSAPEARAPVKSAAQPAAPAPAAEAEPMLSLPVDNAEADAVPPQEPSMIPLPPVEVAPAEPSAAESSVITVEPEGTMMDWIIGTGGLALLAGAALFVTRRRRKRARYPKGRVLAPGMMASTPAAEPAKPVAATPPAEPVIAPVASVAIPAAPITAPAAPAAASAATMNRSRWPELEAMVAQAPSADNPFLTRSKRLRRAKFIMAHGVPSPMVPERPVETVTASAPVAAAQVARPRPVYAQGPANPAPRRGWKPATT